MTVHLLELKNFPILEQLKIEEALLRADDRSFCIINQGSSPAIVMGISSKKEELVDPHKIAQDPIPVIRRFSGGGCVVVDQDTLFVTFIFSKARLPIEPFPEPILSWSENFYQAAFGLPDFLLRENDYAIGAHKCGGNAQYIKKDRWLHHTSFLWNYQPEKMNLLLQPKKIPKYRGSRSHADFLCKLKDHLIDKDRFTKGIKTQLLNRFPVKRLTLDEARSIQERPHRTSTQLI